VAAGPGWRERWPGGGRGKSWWGGAGEGAAGRWEPLPASRGLPAPSSAVTVYAAESGHNVLSHGTADPERLLACFADAMAGLGSLSPGRSVIVFAPEHVAHLARAGWSRARVGAWLYAHAWRSLADLQPGGKGEAAFFSHPNL